MKDWGDWEATLEQYLDSIKKKKEEMVRVVARPHPFKEKRLKSYLCIARGYDVQLGMLVEKSFDLDYELISHALEIDVINAGVHPKYRTDEEKKTGSTRLFNIILKKRKQRESIETTIKRFTGPEVVESIDYLRGDEFSLN